MQFVAFTLDDSYYMSCRMEHLAL